MADVLEILQEALQIEKDGEEFYEEAAQCADNVLAEKTFRGLANAERKHARLFQAYYDKMTQAQDWPPVKEMVKQSTSAPQLAREIFGQVQEDTEGNCQVTEDVDELYDRAMEIERRSIDFYQQQHDDAQDDAQRDFFEYLIDQERGHLRILSRTQEFLADPASWYTEDEQWFATG